MAFTSRWLSAPIIAPDELGYLSGAWALAGWGKVLVTAVGSYPLGYPLLLAPLAMIVRDPQHLYRAVLILNAALLAGLVPCLRSILARLGLAPIAALAGALAIASHPSLVTFAHLALSENLFVPVQAVALLALIVLVDRRSPLAALIFGATLAASPFIRVNGIATAGAGVIVLAALARLEPSRRAALLALTAAVTTGIALLAVPRLLPGFQVYGGVHAADVLAGIAAAPVSVARAFCGQVVSISLSTWLLFPVVVIGAARLLPTVLRRPAGLTAAEWAIVFTGLAAAGTLAISTAFLHAQPRADHAIYARYNEGLLPIVACCGLYLLRTDTASRWLVGLPAVAGLTLLACGARSVAHGVIEVVNVAALFAPLCVWGVRNLPLVTLLLSAVMAVFWYGLRRGWAPAVAAVLLLHVAGGLEILRRYQVPGSRLRATQADFLSGLDPAVRTIGFVGKAKDDWTLSQARFAFPRAAFIEPEDAGADLRLARKGVPAVAGYRAIALQRKGPLVAWMREDIGIRTGLPAVRLPPGSLSDYRALVDVQELSVSSGGRLALRALIINLGDDFLPDASVFAHSPWPLRPVRLGLRFQDPSGAALGENRLELHGPLRAGARASLSADVTLPPAAASVVVDLVHEERRFGVPRRYEIHRDASRRDP